jgi:hypothetical protein
MNIEKSTTHLSLARVLPVLHFCLCLISTLGILVPRWDELLKGWVFLTFADFPVSLVAIAIGWRHQVLGLVFYVVVGTSWWYLLGSKADKFLRHRRDGDV